MLIQCLVEWKVEFELIVLICIITVHVHIDTHCLYRKMHGDLDSIRYNDCWRLLHLYIESTQDVLESSQSLSLGQLKLVGMWLVFYLNKNQVLIFKDIRNMFKLLSIFYRGGFQNVIDCLQRSWIARRVRLCTVITHKVQVSLNESWSSMSLMCTYHHLCRFWMSFSYFQA